MQNSSLETFINLLSVYTHNCKDNYLDCSTLKIQVFLKVRPEVHKCSAALFTAENKVRFKAPPAGRKWICVSFSSVSCRYFFMSSFTKLKFNHSVSVFEMIQSNLNENCSCCIYAASLFGSWLKCSVTSHFKWKKHRQSLILYDDIYFMCIIYLIWGLILTF